MAKTNEQIEQAAPEAPLEVLIGGRPALVTEEPMDDFEPAPAGYIADPTLIFMTRELVKLARGAGDETLAYLCELAAKRARGGRR